jgi:hypothetical protein
LDAAFSRSFDRLPYRSLLPFLVEQNVGVPVPAKRLYPATHTIFGGRRCQLVDHNHHRPFLPVELHHQRLNRQTICIASSNLGGISPDAAFRLSETGSVSKASLLTPLNRPRPSLSSFVLGWGIEAVCLRKR